VFMEDVPDWRGLERKGMVEEELPIANNIPQFDPGYLGLGDDGHTAFHISA